MKNMIALIIFIALPTFVMATTANKVAEKEPVVKEVKEADILMEVKPQMETLAEKQKRIDKIIAHMLEEGPPEPIARGLHVKFGKAAEWVINNANKPNGWSLTGYAKLKISKRNISRWKFGIINGELDWSLYQELENSKMYHHSLMNEWNMRKSREVIVGFSFSKEW